MLKLMLAKAGEGKNIPTSQACVVQAVLSLLRWEADPSGCGRLATSKIASSAKSGREDSLNRLMLKKNSNKTRQPKGSLFY